LFIGAARASEIKVSEDVSDPMFFGKQKDLVFSASADIGNDFQLRQEVTYVFTNKFSASVDFRYRIGTKDNYGNESDGFSNLGVLGTYRAASGSSGSTDMLFGIGYGGPSIVPDYSDRVYSGGVRTGQQWNGMTLALTAMTNWIFDKEQGLAYIDVTPEAYFRVKGGWGIGIGGTLRRATTTVYDQIWINGKIGTVIGKTGWFTQAGYEIDSGEFRIGGLVNLLF